MRIGSVRRSLAAAVVCGLGMLLAAGCGQQQGTTATPVAPTKGAPRSGMLTQPGCVDGQPCAPTGAHGAAGSVPAGHYAYDCKVCHAVGGRVAFLAGGPAYIQPITSTSPKPFYDWTTQTCSNIACHAVKAGTFDYAFQADPATDQPLYYRAFYGSGAPRPTPSWYATGAAACSACHGDPPGAVSVAPLDGPGGNVIGPAQLETPAVWHSGQHGGQGPTGARNQCQFCHPDANSPGNGIGDTITNATLHANGVANVQASFTSQCFGCH